MILIVNEVNSLGIIAKKINSVLGESDWMKKNFSKFCRLTKKGTRYYHAAGSKGSVEISDLLFISRPTLNTHRRNINAKLEVKSFAELHKFALCLGLIN